MYSTWPRKSRAPKSIPRRCLQKRNEGRETHKKISHNELNEIEIAPAMHERIPQENRFMSVHSSVSIACCFSRFSISFLLCILTVSRWIMSIFRVNYAIHIHSWWLDFYRFILICRDLSCPHDVRLAAAWTSQLCDLWMNKKGTEGNDIYGDFMVNIYI